MVHHKLVPDVDDENHAPKYEIMNLINPEPNSQDSVRTDEMQYFDLLEDEDADSKVDDDAVDLDGDAVDVDDDDNVVRR